MTLVITFLIVYIALPIITMVYLMWPRKIPIMTRYDISPDDLYGKIAESAKQSPKRRTNIIHK